MTENKSDQKEIPTKKKTKRKKVEAKKKNNTDQIKDIQSLIEGLFLVTSLKAGEHWVLTSDESKQIAVPLSNILERYNFLEKASTVSDPVALIVASLSITVPRVMISKMSMQQKKTETLKKNGVLGDGNKERNNNEHSGSNVGTAKTTVKSNDGDFIKSIHNEIQEGFF